MDMRWITVALLLSLVAALANTVGGWLTLRLFPTGCDGRRARLNMIAISAGYMLGMILLDRIPDVYATSAGAGPGWSVLAGFLGLFLLENGLGLHAHEHEHGHEHCEGQGARAGECLVPAAAKAAQWGLMLHAWLDGAAIGAAFAVGVSTGLLVALAVIFHKVPEGFLVSSFSLASGNGDKAALRAAWILGATTLVGTLTAVLCSGWEPRLSLPLLALASGSLLYVATCDLIPALHRDRGRARAAWLVGGLLLYVVTAQVLQVIGHHHH